MRNCVPVTESRTFNMLSHLILYSSAMKTRYYPHFTGREIKAQLSTLHEVIQQVRERPEI